MINEFAWSILFLPLLSAVGIFLFAKRSEVASAFLSVGSVFLCFVFAVVLFMAKGHGEAEVLTLPWLQVGNLVVDIGIRLDALSLLMLLVVTGVGSLIHVYSLGYMKGDPGFSRYFGSLSLFMFSMLGIVLSSNFLQMFIFWELVGVSSYLLIGFWFEREAAADAAKKAFLTNRVGDFGFILGILIIWTLFGSIDFGTLKTVASDSPGEAGYLLTLGGLLLFCGALGKSAQFPLHVWLPDAMEGPTPVSALIHAATMVAAGVYMLCRISFLLSGTALMVIGWIGAITAVIAALIAIQQSDIKRILAYSTLSQLGYMVMAVGVGSESAAMYHLVTHAFFKAMLFLGAGSVIHALHHEQDIWNMGGLKEKMPATYMTFFIGTLALCGLPPLSGFFSKDAILFAAWESNKPLFMIGAVVAALTAFYMFRLVVVAFFGPPKSEAAKTVHESPIVMTRPLWILCVPSVAAGFFGIDVFLEHYFGGGHGEVVAWYLKPIVAFTHAPVAAIFGLFAAILGMCMAWGFYNNATSDPVKKGLGLVSVALQRRFYFDELYQRTLIKGQDVVAGAVDWVDKWIVGGLCVRGASGGIDIVGRLLRLLQTGNLQTYCLWFGLGVVAVLYFTIN